MPFSIDPTELVGGLMAGLSKDVLLHPVDTLRARLDVTRTGTASPLGAMVRELNAISATDGLVGLYRGYALCLLGSTPASALCFGSYHAMRRLLPYTRWLDFCTIGYLVDEATARSEGFAAVVERLSRVSAEEATYMLAYTVLGSALIVWVRSLGPGCGRRGT